MSLLLALYKLLLSTRANSIKKTAAAAAAALTFAVVGRREVGEFPQQPSLLSVPEGATNSQSHPAYVFSLL